MIAWFTAVEEQQFITMAKSQTNDSKHFSGYPGNTERNLNVIFLSFLHRMVIYGSETNFIRNLWVRACVRVCVARC